MLRFACIIYQIDHLVVLFIVFHCAMFFWGHLDALMIVARVLYDVICCLLSELDDLSFSLHFVCVSYEVDVYMCFYLHHAIFASLF